MQMDKKLILSVLWIMFHGLIICSLFEVDLVASPFDHE
jgi:hypothetical protein